MMWDDDGRWGMHQDNGVGWLMVVLMVVLVAAVVVALVAFLRGTTAVAGSSSRPAVTPHDARRILQERFARGDIDEEDFRARMRALDDTGSPGA